MKTVLIAAAALVCAGCVRTTARWAPGGEGCGAAFEIKRTAVLYPFRTGGMEFDPATGHFTLLDYDTDGGAAAVREAAYGAASGAAKGAAGL